MLIKIDMNSPEFLKEQEKTKAFADKVCEQFGFTLNPDDGINESVVMGLTRNKLIYNKRYCPCFMVIGETKEEQREADNRICPCKPALEKEIPQEGRCHCGIFCTPEYARDYALEQRLKLQCILTLGDLQKRSANFYLKNRSWILMKLKLFWKQER